MVPTGGPLEAFMHVLWCNFLNDESGATAIEYTLIAASIAIAIVYIVNTLGQTLQVPFTNVNGAIGAP